MAQVDLKKWAENLTKEVYEVWGTKYSFHLPGFKVFYSPLVATPKIMIIGYNPGGDETSFTSDRYRFAKGDFSLPIKHEYIDKDYPIAKKMRELFQDNQQLLEQSGKFNLIFFRSPSEKVWCEIHRSLRQEMESYCHTKTSEILRMAKPRILLVEGLKTYGVLKRILGIFDNETELRFEDRCLGYDSEWKSMAIFGIIHPSGARINRNQWQFLKRKFSEKVETVFRGEVA